MKFCTDKSMFSTKSLTDEWRGADRSPMSICSLCFHLKCTFFPYREDRCSVQFVVFH